MYLLDTNIISELRRAPSGRADKNVITWAQRVDADNLFISSITLLELEMGVLRMERKDQAQGMILRAWLEHHVLPAFDGKILPFDTAIARRCASLHVPNPASERDSMIAATAIEHGLIMVTRNTVDFQASGVTLLNPWNAIDK